MGQSKDYKLTPEDLESLDLDDDSFDDDDLDDDQDDSLEDDNFEDDDLDEDDQDEDETDSSEVEIPDVLDPLVVVEAIEFINSNLKQGSKQDSVLFKCVQLFIYAIRLHPSEDASQEEKKKAASVISGNIRTINTIALPKLIDAIVIATASDLSFVAQAKRDKDGKPKLKADGKPIYERNLFGKLIEKSKKGSFLASEYILTGFNRVQGFKVNTSTTVTADEVIQALSQINLGARAEFTLKNLQDCHSRGAENLSSETQEYLKKINAIEKEQAKYYSEMTDEERKVREEDARNQSDVSIAEEIDSVDEGLFEDYESNIQLCPWRTMIFTAASQIMKVYNILFESCIALGRIYGALEVSKQTGKAAVIRPYSEGGKITLSSSKDIQSNNSMVARDWFMGEMVQNRKFPTMSGKLVCGSNKEVPSAKNIEAGINYYPYFILQYALGFVPDKKKKRLVRHYKWATFRAALEDDVKSRLYMIYKNGGESYFADPVKRDKLIGAFTTAVLILTGDKGLMNYQIRCSSNRAFELTAKGELTNLVTSLRGTEVTVHSMKIAGDDTGSLLIDVQGYGSKAEFLSRPNWAYQALGRIYGGGDVRPNLKEGIPIGLTTRGDLVKLHMGHENNALIIGLYAGSRSGKGVQTLATLCAAYGGGAGVCYVDRKPDMATIFWKLERDSTSGLHTYSMDVTDDRDRLDKNGKPHRAAEYLKSTGHADMIRNITALLYVKHLQVMSLVAQARKEMIDQGKKQDLLLWVLDEVTISTTEMATIFGKKTPSEPKPLKEKATDSEKGKYEKDLYEYQWLTFRDKINEAVSKDINATWGQVRYSILMIGQNPTNQMTGDGANTPLGRLFKAMDSMLNCYIAGRGLQGVYSYGTIALNTKNPTEASLVENNRFFEYRNKAKVTKDEGKGESTYESTVFQPFFCVNTSDVMDPCWTGGIASRYGYEANPEDGEKAMLQRYFRNLKTELGDPENPDARVHRGTGFYGLLDTYMAYIKDSSARKAATDVALGKGYKMVEEALTHLGILGQGNVFGYETVEDFVYDLDPEKSFTTRNEIDAYIDTHDLRGTADSDSGDEIEDLNLDGAPSSEGTDQEPDQESEPWQESEQGTEQGYDGYEAEPDNEPSSDYGEEVYEESSDDENDEGDYSQEYRPTPEEIAARNKAKKEEYEQQSRERIRRLGELSNNDPNFGAVRGGRLNCRTHRLDADGTATIDSDVYRSYMSAELESIDNKFLYSNSFLNKFGSSKHFRQRQKAIINTIKELPRTRTCEQVYIGYDDIIINGCSFGRAQGYGEQNFVNLLEGFSFPDFFKQFKGIKVLMLDDESCKLLHEDNQLGFGGLELVFQLEPKLQKIEYPDLSTGKTAILTRQAASRVKYVKAEEKRYREQEEAEKVLEDSFLFGGPLTGTGKSILKNTERNRSRARKAASDRRTNPRSRARSSHLANRTISKTVVGAAFGVGKLALVPLKAMFSMIRGVRAGNY